MHRPVLPGDEGRVSGGTAAGLSGDGAALCGSEEDGPRGHRLSPRTARGRHGPGRHGGSGPGGDSGWWAAEGRGQLKTGRLGALFQGRGAGGPGSGPGSTEAGVLRGAWAGGWAACKAGPGRGIAVGLPRGPRVGPVPSGVPREKRARRAVWQPVPWAFSRKTAQAAWKDLSLSVCSSTTLLKRENGPCQWEWAQSSGRWRIKGRAVFSSRSSRWGIRFWNQTWCFVMC